MENIRNENDWNLTHNNLDNREYLLYIIYTIYYISSIQYNHFLKTVKI